MNRLSLVDHSIGQPHRPFPAGDIEQSVAARFERQVEDFPDRIAVKTIDRAMTYRDLNIAANRVAQVILRERDDREEPVAFVVEQGAQAIVMLLGALKAGKFYLPLDPSHPQNRLISVIKHAQPRFVLTNTKNQSLASAIAGESCEIINCDALDPLISQQDPRIRLSADRIGYLLYTSGSSGVPKGVTHSQRNILHQIRGYSNGLQISSDDRLTLFHSHAFSASRLDIFGALLNGAAVLPFPVAEAGIPNLVRWLECEKLTVVHWIPTLFRQVVDALEGDEKFPRLRMIVLGSEPVQPRDIARYKEHFGSSCSLVNRFGATETGNICWQFFDRHSDVPSRVVPVGQPIAGADVFVVDAQGSSLGTDAIGEIYVQSRYLSPGYWKSPKLTEAAFLQDPDGGDRRIYRTGDLGRLRADGSLEHLGRKDAQVKVNGFRVEIQEIEALLNQHPEVGESTIDVMHDVQGNSRLVAYVVPRSAARLNCHEIRKQLAATLPHYMVPSRVVSVERLPRTPNGKIDRAGLSTVSRTESRGDDRTWLGLDKAAVSPRDKTEQILAIMWASLLGLATVGIMDNFFDVGGNSMLAAQLMVGIQKTFGRQLIPAAIFSAPTVERLARLVRAKHETDCPSLVPVQPHGSRTPFFLVHGDSSNAFLPGHLDPNQPIYGLEHQGMDGRPATYTTVESIAAHYLRQIMTVQPTGPYLLGGYSFGGAIAFEIAHRLERQGQTVSFLMILDSLFPKSDAPAFTSQRGERAVAQSALGTTHTHLRTLASLGPRDRVTYVLVRLKARWDSRIAVVRRPFNGLVCKLFLKMGWTLPVSVRSFYILQIYKAALADYTPLPFSGPVLYVKSTMRPADHLEEWKKVMSGTVEVCEVQGGHMDVINRENVAIWAERLKAGVSSLQRALA